MNTTITRFLASALAHVSMAAFATDFHVAPNGRDANPGTQAKPFATLERARDALRELKQAGPLKEPVTVRLQGGSYLLSQEVRFGPEDSGTAACPITYTAAEGAAVVLDGGRRLTGWKKHDDKLSVATLPEAAKPVETWRDSFCCDVEGCRKRHTPPSVRFLGRKVYWGVVVVLMAAMQHGLKPARVEVLRERLGIDGRTLERWRTWWLTTFVDSGFWKEARARFMPGLCPKTLPGSLCEAFKIDRLDRLLKLLRFLRPLTTAWVPVPQAD